MEEDIDVDANMAAMLGFSSFGAQGKNKKRRFSGSFVSGDPEPGQNAALKPPLTGANAVGPAAPGHSLPARPAHLPPKPPAAASLSTGDEAETTPGGRASCGADMGEGSQHGGRNKHARHGDGPWWDGYYDPTSNENPWERLEVAAGLPTRGSWMPRGHGYPRR